MCMSKVYIGGMGKREAKTEIMRVDNQRIQE